MIFRRQQHWMLAFLLALTVHSAAFLYSISLPGGEPVYRGGGSYDDGSKPSPNANGIFVQLGNSGESYGEVFDQAALEEKAPLQSTRESLAQGFVASTGLPGSEAEEAEPTDTPDPPEPTSIRVLEKPKRTPANEVGPATEKTIEAEKPDSDYAAIPTPNRKPKPPIPLPEIETLERRLSVQGPPEEEPAKTSSTNVGRQGTMADAESSTQNTAYESSFAFDTQGARDGTASSNLTGEVRKYNYYDQVVLYIKRYGAYPREAAPYLLEDTVVFKFAINRQGKVLYSHLVKPSTTLLFNQAIRRMMKRASPVPPIPPEITKDELTFTVQVHFSPRQRQ